MLKNNTCLFLALLIILPATFQAQTPRFFAVNGKMIRADTFDRKVVHVMEDIGIPGLSLAVISDGKIVYYRPYGYKQLDTPRKVNRKTVFEAASLSKTFLVYVVNRLIDEGRLDPDKPMYQYLPYEPLEHDPRYKRITPRMILSHTSGIENWKRYNNPDTLEILANPGEKFVYSGEGFTYLAKVVEVILHEPYEQYIRERVIKPLRLKNTFPKYTHDGRYPTNYAIGHDSFGRRVRKWKNSRTNPASGMHLTARDYATVLLSLFDTRRFSRERIRGIYHPVIRMNEDNPFIYFGLGLAVQCTPNDTIVFHNGFNDGFESEMWYSPIHRCGLVILTNSEREHVMEKKMCELTAGFDLGPYFADDDYNQYPSMACRMLQLYRDNKKDQMLSEINAWEKSAPEFRTLNELGQLFTGEDTAIARKMLEDNVRLYPDSSVTWYSLGKLYMAVQDYRAAYSAFTKAKELKFDALRVQTALNGCSRKMREANSQTSK